MTAIADRTVPDPTNTVPLPLRAQADVRDRWLTQRLLDVLPGLMDRAGIDLWVVVGREYNEDPVLPTLLPATWLSARRRTILLFHRSDDGVTAAAVARYPVGQFLPAWEADEQPGQSAEESQWAAVRRFVDQAAPRTIGVDVSGVFAHADGLSHTEHGLLLAALGPHADRVVSAEALAVGWLETRLPEEIAALHAMNRLVHQVIDEAYSPAVITVGQTTALDVAWWIRQRFADLGVDGWFQPTVGLQRAGSPMVDERRRGAPRRPVRRGDRARGPGALRRRPVDPGADDRHPAQRLRAATRRDGSAGRAGRCAGGGQPDAGPDDGGAGARPHRRRGARRGPHGSGGRGHRRRRVLPPGRRARARRGAGDRHVGPAGRRPRRGPAEVHTDTVWALELCVRVPVPEWGGQLVRMALEQGIALTGEGVEYLDARQTELILIPSA